MSFLKIFYNGKIITLSDSISNATAFATWKDRFFAVGSDSYIKNLATGINENFESIDLCGRTVVPGFIESHNHLSMYATQLLQVDCSCTANQSIDKIKNSIADKTKSIKHDDWVRGFGYDDTMISDKRHLTKMDLDDAAPNHPVYIQHISAHFAYANSKALEIAKIDRNTAQPEGAEIQKDANGEPTGVLIELSAMRLVNRHIPAYSDDQIKEGIIRASEHYNQHGITSIHDGAIGFEGQGSEIVKCYGDLESQGKLSIRVYMTMVEELFCNFFNNGMKTGFGSNVLKLGSVKAFQDGSIQIFTAAVNEPYHSRPDLTGELVIPQKRLDSMIDKYHSAGCQIAIHANGDRAIESVLLAFDKAHQKSPDKKNRHMIIHCQMASDRQIEKMVKLNIIPNFFVNHIYYWGDRHTSLFLGPKRTSRLDPLNSALKSGLKFCLHSDLPVTPINPIFSIHTAVNRISRNGETLGPEQRIPPVEALKAYTINPAYCSFEENEKGSIEPGKFADFAVLSENPLEVDPHNISNISVLATVLGGEFVFNRMA